MAGSDERRRRAALVGLVVYGLAVVVVLVAPVSYSDIVTAIDDWLHDVLGVPEFGSGWVEFTANILMFAPLGFLLTLLFRSAWIGPAVAVALSVAAEVAQIVIPSRQPTPRDILANALGAALGALIAWLVVLRRRRAPDAADEAAPAASAR